MDQAVSAPRRIGRFKAALLDWLGVPIELTNHQFWSEFNAQTNSGERVSVDRALRMSAVWACVRLISETISTLPIVLYQRVPDRQVARKHPIYALLHDSPNADMTAVAFWEAMLVSMLLWGNAYAQILRTGNGPSARIIALNFMRPDRMTMKRQPNGSMLYRFIDLAGNETTVVENDMLHVPAFSLDGLHGLSPISYANNVIGNALAADRASGRVFSRGLLFSGTFETTNVVKEGLREKFRERLNEYRGAINAGDAPLLEGGVTYKPIGINPNDAQLLETRAFSIEEICRWYRVPPFMVGHSEKSTSWGTGIEQQMIGFLTFALRPWLKRVEQACNRKLLSATDRQEYYTEFNLDALLRADSAGRAEFYSKMVNNGIFDRNEVRAKENLPPRNGADVLTVQVNLTPLDMLGKVPAAPPQPPPQQPSPLNIVVSMPEQHPPQVTMNHSTPINVRSPELRYSAPTINVAQPAINIAAPAAPNVDVHMPDVQVSSPVTVNLPEQSPPRVTINNPAPLAPEPQGQPFAGVEFTYDAAGDVTGAKLK